MALHCPSSAGHAAALLASASACRSCLISFAVVPPQINGAVYLLEAISGCGAPGVAAELVQRFDFNLSALKTVAAPLR